MANASSPIGTVRRLVEDNSGPWMLGEFAAGFFGVLFGLGGDLVNESLAACLRMPWLAEKKSPDDVLPLVGIERRMPRYPNETAAKYRARLLAAWDAYQFAGDESSIESQLAAYGYPGKVSFFPGLDGPFGQPAPYRTQFWLTFPTGTHPVTSDGPPWDSFNWDDGHTWGPVGYTPEFAATLHAIVNKWKPVDWICRGFIFNLGTATWDTFNWDDGTLWDGAVEVEF